MSTIHPTAIIADGAELGGNIEVGPYCVIGPNVRIGDGTKLMSHVVIDGFTTLGKECRVFPFACLGTQTQDLKFRGAKTFVEIGDNTTLREYVTVNASTNEGEITRVGSGCHICAYSHVAHQCTVGDEVIMSNLAHLAGHVVVEDQVVIGGMVGIHQFVRVGRMCMIGFHSKITQDCVPFTLVDGNPPKTRGLNSVGMERRDVSVESRKLVKQAYRLLYRQGLTRPKAIEAIEQQVESCPETEHLLTFLRTCERGLTG
jgi:UDP-N-acetylglucosamine acyltransferase